MYKKKNRKQQQSTTDELYVYYLHCRYKVPLVKKYIHTQTHRHTKIEIGVCKIPIKIITPHHQGSLLWSKHSTWVAKETKQNKTNQEIKKGREK